MAKKLWFKAKTYGWGWIPATWEGWAVILVYVILFAWVMKDVKVASSVGMYFFLKIVMLTTALIAISYVKGEKPGWRWGSQKLIGRGYYYDVYELNEDHVYKKRRNTFFTLVFIIFRFRENLKKIPQYIRFFLVVDKETKKLYKRIPKGAYPTLGNPVFDADGVNYKQEKTVILQDVLDEISEKDFIDWVNGYIKSIHTTWSYGFSDIVFNITVNTGKNKAGNIAQIDFNEITFDKVKVIDELDRKYWMYNFSYKQLPEKYKQIYINKMSSGVNKEMLVHYWDTWGKE
jgi:hypothetical protein